MDYAESLARLSIAPQKNMTGGGEVKADIWDSYVERTTSADSDMAHAASKRARDKGADSEASYKAYSAADGALDDQQFVIKAIEAGFTKDEIQGFMTDRDAQSTRLGLSDAGETTLIPGSSKAPLMPKQQQGMMDGGEVMAGQGDPMGAAGGVDSVSRNLTPADPMSGAPGEEVIDVATSQALGGPQFFAQLKSMLAQIKNPSVVGPMLLAAVQQVAASEQQETAQPGNAPLLGMSPPAPQPGMSPPAPQPGMTGQNVALPSGTGQSRPNPVLA